MSGNTPIGGPNLEHSSPPQPPRPGSGPQGGSATRQHIIRYLRKLHNWLDEWSAADTERLADASAAFVSTVVQEGGLSAGSLELDFRDDNGNCQEVTGISILELCNGSSLTDTSDGEFRMEQSDDTTLANLTLNNLVSDGGTITLDNGTTTIGSGELNLLDGMTSKTGSDTNFVTGTAGTDGNLAEWNGDGDLVDSGTASGDVVTGPAGSNQEVQFNDGGVFGTESDFVYLKSSNTLGIGTSSPNTSALAHLNGSGSDAVFRMDSTSADVKMTQTVLGAQDWSIGADNSDSAAYKIANSTALGTNTALRIDPSTQALQFNSAYEFPTSDGSANQVLLTDGSGNLRFADIAVTDTYKIPLLYQAFGTSGKTLNLDTENQEPATDQKGNGSLTTNSSAYILNTGGGAGSPAIDLNHLDIDLTETGGSSSAWQDFYWSVGFDVSTIDSATSATLKCRLVFFDAGTPRPVPPSTFKLAWGDRSQNANYSDETSNLGTSFSTIDASMDTTGLETPEVLWAGFTWEIAAGARVHMQFEALWIEVEV